MARKKTARTRSKGKSTKPKKANAVPLNDISDEDEDEQLMNKYFQKKEQNTHKKLTAKELKQLFDRIDVSGDQEIDAHELLSAASILGLDHIEAVDIARKNKMLPNPLIPLNG